MPDPHPGDDALLDLALDRSGEPERPAVLRHLSACPRCRDAYHEIAVAAEQVLVAAPHLEPPPGFERRALAAMGVVGPGPTWRLRQWLRSRPGMVAAAAAAGLVLGVGGTLALTGTDGPPPVSAYGQATLATGQGEVVGTVARSFAHGRPVLVITVTDGPPGMRYECVLRLADGRRVPSGVWTLESSTATWVVDIPDGQVAELLLVTDTGDVWSSTRL